MPECSQRAAGRVRRQRRRRAGHRPGMHPRAGDPAEHRHEQLPVVNVENACASASTALNQACAMVSAGLLRYRPRSRCREAVPRGQEEDRLPRSPGRWMSSSCRRCSKRCARARPAPAPRRPAAVARARKRSMFMDIYAAAARAAHAALRHDGRAVRRHCGEELLSRQLESPCPVPRGAQCRGGVGRADDR